jgi:hypothetical protein
LSAFAVKVSSDKQTLILAGEAIPPRRVNADHDAGGSEMRVRLQRVTMLFVQGDYGATALAAESGAAKFLAAASERVLLPSAAVVDTPAVAGQSLVPYLPPKRAVSAGGAAEYARTQNLSGDRTTSQLIDTYA